MEVKRPMPETKNNIWDAFGIVAGLLVSLLLWFKWIADQEFTIASAINVAIVWAVIIVILTLVPKFVGYLLNQIDVYLK